MSNKGLAIVLATAIYAGNRGLVVDTTSTAERIYTVIAACPDFRMDEVKADVYAQLAENLTADTTFERAINIIENALSNTTHALKVYHG